MLVGALRMHERCWVGPTAWGVQQHVGWWWGVSMQGSVVHVAREIPQPGGFSNMWGGGGG